MTENYLNKFQRDMDSTGKIFTTKPTTPIVDEVELDKMAEKIFPHNSYVPYTETLTKRKYWKKGYEYKAALQDKVGGWISVKDKTPELLKDKDYSENVLAWEDGRLQVMVYGYHSGDEPESGFYWANCNGDINGDGEWDDNYYPTHWQPLPTQP